MDSLRTPIPSSMRLITFGLNHKTAPVELRESVAFPEASLSQALTQLRQLPEVQEALLLSTCNRTEIYACVDENMDSQIASWLQQQAGQGLDLSRYLYQHADRDCVLHAMRVASGLDSMILGEPQILGQMKQSYQAARDMQATGPLLSRLFEHVFSVAKLVRTETEIGANPVSVAFAAISLARQIFADLGEQTALLIGAGETIELTARHLAEQRPCRMIVANRSVERAQRLAHRHHGYAISLEDIPTHLSEADIIISSTASAEPVLMLADVKAALRKRRHKPVFMLDLAVPRDIEPAVGKLEDVYLYTVDDLKNVIADSLRSRQQAARAAESLIQLRAEEFMHWLVSRDASSTISALRERAQAEQAALLERAQRMLAQGKPVDEVLQFVTNGLVNKLLHHPSTALRSAGAEEQAQLLEAAVRLFDLDEKQ